MTFHSIVRSWCKRYPPMRDRRKNRRFYIAKSIDGVRSMPKSISTKFSPCVVMEAGEQGEIDGGLATWNYPVYFFVRAERLEDSDALAVAYKEATYHAMRFYAWLKRRHEEDSPNGDFGRINLEDRLYVEPIGPLEDGWAAEMIQFERMEPIELCVDDELDPEDFMPEDEDDGEQPDGDAPGTEAEDDGSRDRAAIHYEQERRDRLDDLQDHGGSPAVYT